MTMPTIKAGAAVPAAPKPTYPAPVFTGERQPSIIPADVSHVIVAGGFYGSGKTTFVCGIDHPANILMIDLESKGELIAHQLGITNYFPVVQDAATLKGFDYKPYQIFDRVKQILVAMPQDRFTTLVIDGVSILQEGLLEAVKLNPTAWGINPKNAESGSMGGAWPGVATILNQIFTQARSRGVKVIGLTTEVKAKWGSTGPILNKFELKGVSLLSKMSILTVIMTKGMNKYLGAPSAIVMKEQLGKYEWSDELKRSVVRKRIPPKLPLAEMAEVYRYLREPADYGNLRLEEIPTTEELEPFLPIVSKEQLSWMREFLDAARLGLLTEEEPE